MPTREWIFVSDLHLASRPGARDPDGAMARFVDDVVLGSGSEGRRLVLLGDTFDLHGPVRVDRAAVVRRLQHLASVHAPVMEALGRCLEAGIGIDVVGGNHDLELTSPEISAVFERILRSRGGSGGAMRFFPWVLHEPGVFYAEHGNQHYPLNRFPTILATRLGRSGPGVPVTPLGANGPGSEWSPTHGPRSGRVSRALLDAERLEALRSGPWYAGLLAAEADRLGLPPDLVADLAGLSRFRMTQALAGAARRVSERKLGYPQASPLLEAAAEVHVLMARHGVAVPAYVFGHDHRATRRDLPVIPAGAYLNCGTWSDLVRGTGPDQQQRSVFPFARVAADDGGRTSSTLAWHHVSPSSVEPRFGTLGADLRGSRDLFRAG